jgi:hypothetical protein
MTNTRLCLNVIVTATVGSISSAEHGLPGSCELVSEATSQVAINALLTLS